MEKYKILSVLGKGKFGTVLRGVHVKTEEQVAIKFEEPGQILLKNETTVLNYLYHSGCRTIPYIYWFGKHIDKTCLVMTLYDCSLFEYNSSNTLNLSQVNSIMRRCVNILESIHTLHVLHRDIKPQNFMFKNGELYIIDFGFSTFFTENTTMTNTQPNKLHSTIIGTPKYVSYYVHCGEEYGPRDDMISLGYIFLYLLFGELIWENPKENTYVREPGSPLSEIHTEYPKNIIRRDLKRLDHLLSYYSESNTLCQFFKYCYSLSIDHLPNYYCINKLFDETI